MQDAHIIIIAAGLLGLIFFALTIWVVTFRTKTKMLLGDGSGSEDPDKQALNVAIRAHANFAEFVPLNLLLLAGMAYQGANSTYLAVLCGALVLGRVLHPFGIRIRKPNVARAVGALLTWIVLINASVSVLVGAL